MMIKTKALIVASVLAVGATMVAPALGQSSRGANSDTLVVEPNSDLINVIVVLNNDFARGNGEANQAAAATIARGLGVSAHRVWGHALFGFAARIPQGRLNALHNDPRVAYIEIDEINTIPTPPDRAQKPPRCADDPTGPGCGGDDEDPNPPPPNGDDEVPWGIDRIGAYGITNTGADVHVFIIDSGISVGHEDLFIGESYAVVNCSPAKNCNAAWDDDNGHGSHVAGTVGALDNDLGVIGVAPGVTLHAVKVLDKRGAAFSSDIISGINWVAQQTATLGPVIANISIGGSGSKTGTCDPVTGWDESANAYQEAMCNAAHAGVIFAVAAGNEGTDAATRRPASYDDTSIAVSATGQTADQLFDGWPDWSNWGDDPATWAWNDSEPVAIAAPGMGVLSTWKNGDYNTISGTSMASPHVAGALALWLAANSGQSPDYTAFENARDALLSNAQETAVGGSNFTIKGGNPHDEDFLDVRSPAFELPLP